MRLKRKACKKIKFDWAKQMRKKPTKAEKIFWEFIRKNRAGFDANFHRQKLMLGFIVDFWCPKYKLVIEIDGSSHEGRSEYDKQRDDLLEYCLQIKVLRFTNEDIFNNIDYVLDTIKQNC